MHPLRRFAHLSPQGQALLKFGLALVIVCLAVACLYFDIRSVLPPYVYGVALLGLAGLLGQLSQRRLADAHAPLAEPPGPGVQ